MVKFLSFMHIMTFLKIFMNPEILNLANSIISSARAMRSKYPLLEKRGATCCYCCTSSPQHSRWSQVLCYARFLQCDEKIQVSSSFLTPVLFPNPKMDIISMSSFILIDSKLLFSYFTNHKTMFLRFKFYSIRILFLVDYNVKHLYYN